MKSDKFGKGQTFAMSEFEKRLRRFIDLNYVLLIVGLLLACACVVSLVTGYDGNEVLFYICCAGNLILCNYTLSKSFNKLEKMLVSKQGEKNE